MTGRHRGPKRKLPAVYRAPSYCDAFSSSSVVSRTFSASCVYLHYLRWGHRPHPLGYLCAKFCFCCGLHCWASPWRKIAYSITQSISHSLSLFNASGTEAFASEKTNTDKSKYNRTKTCFRNLLHLPAGKLATSILQLQGPSQTRIKSTLCDWLVWNVDTKLEHLGLELFPVVTQKTLEMMFARGRCVPLIKQYTTYLFHEFH